MVMQQLVFAEMGPPRPSQVCRPETADGGPKFQERKLSTTFKINRSLVLRRAGVFKECDLSRVMRLVRADEPLAIIAGRTPGPDFIDGHKPRIIALAELRQRFRPGLLKYIQVVVSVVALDGLPTRVSQIHRRVPLLLHRIRPAIPFSTAT